VRRYVTQGDSGGGTSSGALSRARAKARIREGEWEPMAPSLAKEGVRDAPVWTTLTRLFAGSFRVRGRDTSVSSTFNASRETSRVPASARQSQNVPVSYSRGIGISPFAGNTICPFAGLLCKPSDGLEPSTPSLPWNDLGNRSRPTATVFACLGRFRRRAVCQRLPRVATAGLHKGSTLSCLCWLRPRNWTISVGWSVR
jgi:hypothetical protein